MTDSSSIYAMDMAAANGTTITAGHEAYCRIHGHAGWVVGNVDTGSCARCGITLAHQTQFAFNIIEANKAESLAQMREAAETVANYAGVFHATGARADISAWTVRYIAQALAALDNIVRAGWEFSLMEALTEDFAAYAKTVDAARDLAKLVRFELGAL